MKTSSKPQPTGLRQHELKTLPEYFAAIESGEKTFEARKNDRGFAKGDVLRLREWSDGYTGRETTRIVTYILLGPAFGIARGWCVMGLSVLTSGGTGERSSSGIVETPEEPKADHSFEKGDDRCVKCGLGFVDAHLPCPPSPAAQQQE